MKLELTVRAERVPDFVLRDGGKPDGRVAFDLGGRDEKGVVTRVDRAEAPEGEAEAAVGVQAQGDVT